MKIYYPFFLLIILFPINCQSQNNGKAQWNRIDSEQLSNSILMLDYPEVKNNEDAWSDKREVSFFNISQQKSYRLTYDLYSDSYATLYPNKKDVYFESKRPAKGDFAENGTPHIYKLDLSNGNISEYDSELKEKFPNAVGFECSNPIWSSDYKLAFTTEKEIVSDFVNYLCIYSEKDSKLHLIDSTKSFFTNVSWASNNHKLYYEIFHLRTGKQHIIYDLVTKTKLYIDIDTSLVYWFKSWTPNGEEIIYQNMNDDEFIELISYNINKKIFSNFYTNRTILGKFLCFGDSDKDLFINEINTNDDKYNLLKLNLSTGKIIKLNQDKFYIDDRVSYIK